MAAESDGMVSGGEDEQPMDLSRASRKPTRIMPPLIPISLLRSGCYHRGLVGKNVSAKRLSSVKNELDESNKDEDWRENHTSPKQSRLDRARSVPQLTPLHSLQRHKSLSESRIPVASSEVESKTWSLDSDEDLQQRLQLSENNDALFKSSWIYVGYYSQLLHRFQTHELLRQFSLQQDNKIAEGTPPKIADTSEDACDIKRRQTRPLTGKHVRPGTGASPATLLSLRRKIQARQQLQK